MTSFFLSSLLVSLLVSLQNVEVNLGDILDKIWAHLPVLSDLELVLLPSLIHTVSSSVVSSDLIQHVSQVITHVVEGRKLEV